jgi:ectoine hydroxylase-related dioxygenase (phytanoyl-CoA dioxygenase family)
MGRTGKTTRVHDFVNRGAEFDELYVHPPLLEACCRVIGQPFKLSALLGRTLHPGAREQDLHVDFARDERGWPMLGFIVMIDEFRTDNGATCFVPGSHRAAATPATPAGGARAGGRRLARACGPAGSMILFNGSVLHGHGANETARPRRSIQGAYIRSDAPSGFDLASRMRPETLSRVSVLARHVLGV